METLREVHVSVMLLALNYLRFLANIKEFVDENGVSTAVLASPSSNPRNFDRRAATIDGILRTCGARQIKISEWRDYYRNFWEKFIELFVEHNLQADGFLRIKMNFEPMIEGSARVETPVVGKKHTPFENHAKTFGCLVSMLQRGVDLTPEHLQGKPILPDRPPAPR